MERDISFSLLIKILKKAWWKILIIAVAVMMLVAAYTHFLVPKKYSSSIQFYIVNIDANTDYTSTQTLSAASQLINDYTDIIKSENLLTLVQKKLEEMGYQNVSVSSLQRMLQHSAKADSSVFTLTVVHTDPTVAYDVARVIADVAPKAVTDIAKPDSYTHERLGSRIHDFLDNYINAKLKLEGKETIDMKESEIIDVLKQADAGSGMTAMLNCIYVLSSPKQATAPISPNVTTTTMLGGAAAAVVAYVLFLLKALFEQGITNEEDLKKLVGRPVIGVIPHWDGAPKK